MGPFVLSGIPVKISTFLSSFYFHTACIIKYIKIVKILEPENKGGSQLFEQLNVERPIFRNFDIPNIKRTKDELFDFLNFEFIF